MSIWSADNIPDQRGRKAIVTGANTGIGFETALQLARKGAHVTLACRSKDRGQAAVRRILDEDPNLQAVLELCDLSDLVQVRAFAERYRSAHSALDLLVLNAGVMAPPQRQTAQGFELQIGVNHLGHFVLAGELMPLLKNAPAARVVTVSSIAAQQGRMFFESPQLAESRYNRWRAYGQSKLANQLFTRALQHRLVASGSSVRAMAAHPGWTATDLQRTVAVARLLNPLLAMKPPQGALPTLRAATDPEARNGDYFGPSGWMQLRGNPIPVPMVKQALRDDDMERLWSISEQLTGTRYPLDT